MTRRSAQNQRYQKHAQVGSTRKSAASMKPKREIGEKPLKQSGTSEKRKGAPPGGFRDPDTPEFKRWRKIWFGLLVAAMVFSIGAFAVRGLDNINTLSLVFAYSCLFSAFYVDLTKIRRMRKEYDAERWEKAKPKAETAAEEASDSDVEVEVNVKVKSSASDTAGDSPAESEKE